MASCDTCSIGPNVSSHLDGLLPRPPRPSDHSLGLGLRLLWLVSNVTMHACCPVRAQSTIACPLERRHRRSTRPHTPQLMQHEHHHEPLIDGAGCLCCSLHLLSIQDCLAATHKCHSRVRHFGRVFDLPVQSGSMPSAMRAASITLGGLSCTSYRHTPNYLMTTRLGFEPRTCGSRPPQPPRR